MTDRRLRIERTIDTLTHPPDVPNYTGRVTAVKRLISIIAGAVVVALAAPAFAQQTEPQPLTRADCDKAGMKWDDAALVCAGRTGDRMEKKVSGEKGAANKKHGQSKSKHGYGKKAHAQAMQHKVKRLRPRTTPHCCKLYG